MSSTSSRRQTIRRAPTRKSEETRWRILEVARRLFNERGTAPVSTNRIAAEAGISPGNLYYYFADKQELIRALHAQYCVAHEGRWEPVEDARANLARMHENLVFGTGVAWEYRFFEREFLALLRADPALRAAHLAVYERKRGELMGFGEQLVAQGMLQPPRPPYTLSDLIDALWLVTQAWLPFLDLTGDPDDPAQLSRGTELVLVVLDRYLTAKGRREFEAVAPTASPRPRRRKRGEDFGWSPGRC